MAFQNKVSESDFGTSELFVTFFKSVYSTNTYNSGSAYVPSDCNEISARLSTGYCCTLQVYPSCTVIFGTDAPFRVGVAIKHKKGVHVSDYKCYISKPIGTKPDSKDLLSQFIGE